MNAMFKKGAAVLATGIVAVLGTAPAFAATTPTAPAAFSDQTASIATVEAQIGTPATDDNDQASINALMSQASNTPGFKQKLKDLGDELINNRIAALNKLETTVNGMSNLTDSQQQILDASIQMHLNQMYALKTKIDNDVDLQTLENDVESITIDYRIFILVIPQILTEAHADAKLTVAANLTTLANQLQVDINNSTSTNKQEAQMVLIDMRAKIFDVKTNAQEAYNGVSQLVPDRGDGTVRKSNKAALGAAQNNLDTADTDIAAAYADAMKIEQLLGLNPSNVNVVSANGNGSTIMKVNPINPSVTAAGNGSTIMRVNPNGPVVCAVATNSTVMKVNPTSPVAVAAPCVNGNVVMHVSPIHPAIAATASVHGVNPSQN